MATHVLLTPEARGSGVLDVTPHRAELPRAYNVYRRAGRPAEADARELVLRPLFLLCFLLADSSRRRTAPAPSRCSCRARRARRRSGSAYELGSSDARRDRAHLAAATLGSSRSTGIYDEVVTYDAVGSLDPAVATVTVDMAGDGALRRAIHEHFGDALRRSVLVGATHSGVASFAPDPGLPGPAPTFFFVPDRMRVRAREWGAAVFEARVERAFAGFSAWSEGWLRLDTAHGPDAVLAAYGRVLRGEVRPDSAIVAAISAARAA